MHMYNIPLSKQTPVKNNTAFGETTNPTINLDGDSISLLMKYILWFNRPPS